MMMLRRSSRSGDPVVLADEIRITGTGSVAMNLYQLDGAVQLVGAAGIIRSITTLTNMTAVRFDLWDGTVQAVITDDGAILSGATVGTVLLKDKPYTEDLSVYPANQGRVSEVFENLGRPMLIVAKQGTPTYIRLTYNTTDAPLDFTLFLRMAYEPINGGSLSRVPSNGLLMAATAASAGVYREK